MNGEVQKVESSVPAVAPPPSTEAGVLKSDIVLAKVLCMQGISELVMEGKAAAGDFVLSTSGEKIGGRDKPIDFIPLKFDNLWMIQSQEGKNWKFEGYEKRTSANELAEWEYLDGSGRKMKRTKVMHLYALLPADVQRQLEAMKRYQETGEIPDVEAALLPVVLSFRNTSFKAAKDISTLFLKAESLSREMGIPVPVYTRTMRLSNTLEKKEIDGNNASYYVMHVEPAGKTDPAYVPKAKFWNEQLGQMSFRIDDSDDKEPAGEGQADPAAHGDDSIPY